MSDNSLQDNVLNTIQEEHIAPKARWHFVVKDVVIWATGIMSLIIGSLAFAVMLFMFQTNDWSLSEHVANSSLQFFLSTLPYVWLGLLILFTIIAYWELRHTKKGYKYSVSTIILASVILSGVLGSGLYAAGVGEALEHAAVAHVPVYAKHLSPQGRIWTKPGDGRLAGMVVNVIDDDHIVIMDIEKKLWEVDLSGAQGPKLLAQHPRTKLRLLGEKISDSTFKARIIAPVLTKDVKERISERPELRKRLQHFREKRIGERKFR